MSGVIKIEIGNMGHNIHTKIQKNGVVIFTPNQQIFLAKHVGKWLTSSIEKPKRSNQQNRFYWLYLHIIEVETGNNADDMHEYFKRTLLSPRFISVKDKNGKEIEVKIPGSTTKQNKIEMGEYLDKISAKTGVPIPNPCENGFFCGKKNCPVCAKK